MTSLVLSPYLHGSPAVELASGLWRKKVLPVGDVEYKGRLLHFTAPYLASLVQAFRSRAYDQVPLQLADAENRHSNDPERTRGEIIDMETGPDGLWITAKVTPQGEAVLAANPKLGVSARIVEDYARSDGKHYPAAIQHILATLDPRIPGLGTWEPVVEASNEYASAVIDLSGSRWVGEPGPEDGPPADSRAWEVAALGEALREVGLPGLDAEEIVAAVEAEEIIADMEADPEAFGLEPGGGETATEHATLARPENTFLDAGGGYGYDLTGDPHSAVDLANITAGLELAQERAAAWRAEESEKSAPAPRRSRGGPTDEVKMARAMGRAARTTLAPPPGTMAFASPSEAGRTLAALRWQQDAAAGRGLCGPADDFGRCASPAHLADCPDLAPSPDDMALVRDELAELAAEPVEDSQGRTWVDQNAQPMTWTAHIEALTGERLGTGPDGLFETGQPRRDLMQPLRSAVFGDPDGGEPGQEVPGDTQVSVLIAAQQMGLTARSAAEIRESGRRQRDRIVTHLTQQRGSRAVHPGDSETSRDRAQRLRETVIPVPVNDPVGGELPVYAAGGR